MINVKNIGEVTVLEPRGELVTPTAIELKTEIEHFIKAGRVDFIINFEDITRIDSEGLNVLLTSLELIENEGGSLKLICLNKECTTILELVGLIEEFQIYSDLDSALGS